MSDLRIGFGTDIHRLAAGRPLIIGGVAIESDLGADGHSDADVLLHAITDALLGSLALGDIGTHFSNSDPRWSGADSMVFLRHAAGLLAEKGYDFDMATPVVVSGPSHTISHKTDSTKLLMPFESEYGRATIEICFE